ncbi:MAG: zinc ribbon domain-containing protein, partial [Acidobacteria bacterium]|nr:zinc ribbon domain-containing protein [Acidobacteriota bacterium]
GRMFCPKCAAQNLDGASFCRSCGANISLIPDALSGQLPQAPEKDDVNAGFCGTRQGRQPTLENAFKSLFMGVAFLLVSVALGVTRTGRGWWMFMLIPAFIFMGTGIAQYIQIKDREKKQSLRAGTQQQPSIQPRRSVEAFSTRNTGELVAPPPSVTEGTTRHLGAEAPTRHFDGSSSLPKESR